MAFTFEEWEKEYNDNRPVEPCCAREDPDQWAEIVDYAEYKLQEAFDAGYQSCLDDYGWRFLKDGNKGKKEAMHDLKRIISCCNYFTGIEDVEKWIKENPINIKDKEIK